MPRRVYLGAAAVAAVWIAAAPCAAAPTLAIGDLPPYYTAGQPFTFSILLAGAQGLASYNIDVVLELETGTVDTDAWLVEPDAPPARYVFGDTAADRQWFGAAVQTVGAAQRLTVSDLHDPDDDLVLNPVDTVAGVNDLVAVVTVETAPSLAGDVRLRLDAAGLELDTADLDAQNHPIPIEGFAALEFDVAGRDPAAVPLVPEPGTLLLLAAAAPWLLGRARRRA
jgi:hypothetical protein